MQNEHLPVLVEAASAFLAQVLSPDGLEGTETSGGLNVSNDTDGNHGRCLQNSDGIHNFLLVGLCSREMIILTRASFNGDLLEPGLSTSRTTWVIPAL